MCSNLFPIQQCLACGNKGKLRNMGHGLANFIVRQHKNSKIDNKRSKKTKEIKTVTTKVQLLSSLLNSHSNPPSSQDIYQGEKVEAKVAIAKVNGGVKDEWDGGDWTDSESEDEAADQLKKLSLREMKPSDMSGEQRGLAFEEYVQDLIDDGSLVDMMKAKEKIMLIVLKADYYSVKPKG